MVVTFYAFWVKSKGLPFVKALPLVKAFCLSYHLINFFCLLTEQLIFKRHLTTNGRTIPKYCVFKLKQFNIYLFRGLPKNIIIEICRTLKVEDKTCCTYFNNTFTTAPAASKCDTGLKKRLYNYLLTFLV